MSSEEVVSLAGVQIAVVGGGVFGCTAALDLDAAGAMVDLYEAAPTILDRASRRNLMRLHRGYHYPRSVRTARLARDAAPGFERQYPTAISYVHDHYYSIAVEGSRTSVDDFVKFCDDLDLPYDPATPDFLRHEAIDATFLVDEAYIDFKRLKDVIEHRLFRSNVTVKTGVRATPLVIDTYDYVVLAGYAATNSFLSSASLPVPRRRLDICEVCVVRCPPLVGRSVVVLDGPFVSLVPLPRTDLSLLYHVDKSVHRRYDNLTDVEEDRLARLLGGTIRAEPESTNFEAMRRGAERFVIGAQHIEYLASAFELRSVLADSFGTDARPTEVSWVGPNVLLLFSGKISTCVAGATCVREMLIQDLQAPATMSPLRSQRITTI